MPKLSEICEFLDRLAPPELAEDWDNVGLLVGDADRDVRRVMTCLTVTPDSAAEAMEESADLVVSHHPLPFRPVRRITGDSTPGRMLLDLIGARVAVYSAHTAFDSTGRGVNARLAEGLGLGDVAPLAPHETLSGDLGGGRCGELAAAIPLIEAIANLKRFLGVEHVQVVGRMDRPVRRVAVACGAAGEFLTQAIAAKCDLFVTGETNFHTCLEAQARGIALVLTGHFASERFAVELLAGDLQPQFAELEVWASRREANPLFWS